jgi:hypothetical protein
MMGMRMRMRMGWMGILFLSMICSLGMGGKSGLECIKNKDCTQIYEHLCNHQAGLWIKNYVLSMENGTTYETVESCSCCFSPEIFRQKVTQRTLLQNIGLTLESQEMASKYGTKPCSPLRKPCVKTFDCCFGYCTNTEEGGDKVMGECFDPLLVSQGKEREREREPPSLSPLRVQMTSEFSSSKA